MKRKDLIWIDDRNDDMEQVVKGMFCRLWGKGIFNRTLFFGDAIQEVDDNLMHVFQYTVVSEFYWLWRQYGDPASGQTGGLQAIKERLESGNQEEILSALVSRIPFTEDNIRRTVTAWKQGIDKATWLGKGNLPEALDIAPILNHITADGDGTTAFALDVILLEGDGKKLNCEADYAKPIISMELYHYITEILHAKCTLYSRYTYLNMLQRNWVYLYTARYGDDSKQVTIHPRRGLYEGQIDPDLQNEFVGYFKTAGDNDTNENN